MYKELTVNDVAKSLGVTVQAVSKYLRIGKLSGFKVGGRWRIPAKSVEEFLFQSNIKIMGGITHE
jgi:excisionase family DNA binding protein